MSAELPARDSRQRFTGRRIVSVEILSRRGLKPFTVNEVIELAAVALQPGLGFLGIFRSARIPCSQIFRDAHLIRLDFFRQRDLRYAIGCRYSAEYRPVA
jgi:hypothetical protein